MKIFPSSAKQKGSNRKRNKERQKMKRKEIARREQQSAQSVAGHVNKLSRVERHRSGRDFIKNMKVPWPMWLSWLSICPMHRMVVA